MSFLGSADERALAVEFSDDALSVSLRDGRVITVPLVWYPRLLNATSAQRENWKIAGGGYGLHWPDLDEDLSTEGLLRGAPAPKTSGPDLRTEAGITLSKRERHIVLSIAEGLADKDIAARLRVSEATIQKYIQRILIKLDSQDRLAIAQWVTRRGPASLIPQISHRRATETSRSSRAPE
jgi:DNA-binding CsgD family transcriptional regulator